MLALSGAKLRELLKGARGEMVGFLQFHLVEVSDDELAELASTGLEGLDHVRAVFLELLLDLFKEGLEVDHELLLGEARWRVLEVVHDVVNHLDSLLEGVAVVASYKS